MHRSTTPNFTPTAATLVAYSVIASFVYGVDPVTKESPLLPGLLRDGTIEGFVLDLDADRLDEALAHAGAWDLLLTDVVMPVMNGPELAQRLVAERGPFRVLFTSGYSGDTMVERGTLDGHQLDLQGRHDTPRDPRTGPSL